LNMPMDSVQLAMGALGAGAVGVASYATFAPRAGVWCPVISRAPAGSVGVALTFDDGPWPEATPTILDTLREARVSAAFFVIGRNAARWPDLLARIHGEGHILGNHSFDHHHFGLMGRRRYWLDQIDRTDDQVARAAGARPAYFRPPMGFTTWYMAAGLRDRGHSVVAWSRRAMDGLTTTPERIRSRLAGCQLGDILTLHDGVDPHRTRDAGATISALRPLIRSLRDRGLEPTRLDQLLKRPAYQ
jgi:peptidoglycan/xylan/chitin deacetylase (PgdA/CDA1 family)